MKIAYLCADLGIPLFGRKGASIHVRELVRALAGLGHEVLVVTARAEGDGSAGVDVAVEALEPDALHEEAVDALRRDGRIDPAIARDVRALLYRERSHRAALDLVRSFAPDVVYERYSLFGDAGLASARALDVPLVLEVNAPLTDEQARHRGLAFVEAAREIEQRVLRAADRVVTVSRALELWLVQIGVHPARVAVVPNGVDAARFAVTAEERESARAALGVDGARSIGFVGSLKPWHDLASLIAAVADLGRRRADTKLVVVGEGPQREALEAEAVRRGLDAVFTSSVPYDRVPAYLAALDVAVAPYASANRFYFSPLKVPEYLAAGVPVVAADVGDLRHCVRPHETGWLYEPGDADALADAIACALDDPQARHLALAGREHVRNEHSWRKNAERVVELATAARSGR